MQIGGDIILNIQIQYFKELYQNISLQIESKSITTVIGRNPHKFNEFISIIKGKSSFNGDIILDNISLKLDNSHYKKKIDNITGEEINSTLSIDEYLNFYAMLRGIHEPILSKRKKEIFSKHNYINSFDVRLNELLYSQRIYLRFLASLIKMPALLIIENNFIDLDPIVTQAIISIINDYVSQDGTCIYAYYKSTTVFNLTDSMYYNENFKIIL